MQVTLSKEEVALIAAEVVRQLKGSGQSVGAVSAAKPKGRPVGSTNKSAAKKSAAPKAAVSLSDGADSYNIEAAAEATGRHPNTIRMHIKSGKLGAKMVKGSYRIKARDLAKHYG